VGFPDDFLESLHQYLQPGTSALLLLMEYEWVKKATEALADWEGIVVQQTLSDRIVADLLDTGE
jgi:uncharacterized membrane protein